MKVIETLEGVFIPFTPFLFYKCTSIGFITINTIYNGIKFTLLVQNNFQGLVYPSSNNFIKIKDGLIPKLIKSILCHPSQVITNDVLQSFLSEDEAEENEIKTLLVPN